MTVASYVPQELPHRSMIVAYEHHLKRDLIGYPRYGIRVGDHFN